MKYIFKGKLSIRKESMLNEEVIFIDDEILPMKILKDVWGRCYDYKLFKKEKVNLRYALSDIKIDNIDEAFADFSMQLYGNFETEYSYIFGTAWTGVYGLDETLKIDGHDLLKELYNHAEKERYIYLEIITEEVK